MIFDEVLISVKDPTIVMVIHVVPYYIPSKDIILESNWHTRTGFLLK